MPENRQVHNNAVSTAPCDAVQEAVSRLNIHDNQEGDGARSALYPHRPGEPDCIYFLRTGFCGFGSNCRFNHPSHAFQGLPSGSELPQRVGQPDCGYYLKTGTCKYGSSCKYHHPRDRNGAAPVYLNILGLPIRQDEKPCAYYMRTGLCKFGPACKFHHPQPSLPGTVLPAAGPAAGGASGSSVVSSSSLPYIGGLSTWSLPRASYLSGTRVHGQQAYMPVVYSPSQGNLPTQGWSTYLGNMSPMSSAGILGPSLVYNSRNQAESGSSGQMNLLSTSLSSFPERPGQPECQYFMNTGSCKYGADCKYHHPREKVSQLANSMGSYGLPSRPGQPVCSNYTLYGLCKYGPTCKFDHPVAGYSYNYGLSLQSLSMFNPSHFSYPRSSAATHGSETSLSKSSKVFEWIQKPEQPSHQESAVGTPEDQPGEAVSPPHSLPSSEIPQQDQSD